MTKADLLKITSPQPELHPKYIVGEQENWGKFRKHLETFSNVEESYAGTIQGITGNGKTHFIRYAKEQLKDEYNVFIIEDMFSQSNFIDSLRNIYKRLISNDNDSTNRIEELAKHIKNLDIKRKDLNKKLIEEDKKSVLELFNPVLEELAKLEAIERYPSKILHLLRKNIDHDKTIEVLIRLFSGEVIQNKEDLELLQNLNLKRNYLIEKEDDFVDYFVDYIELVYALTGKYPLIFMDEADRAIALESSTILPKTAFQVLDSLREVFNKLRTPTFFTIGTTTQAWRLIENSISAFARRFNRFEIVLKEGKSSDEIIEFIQQRSVEKGLDYSELERDGIITDKLINELSYFSNTWKDVINNIKKYVEEGELVKAEPTSLEEIENEILKTLNIFRNLELSDIIENNQVLKKLYPTKRNLPVSIMTNLFAKKKFVDRYKRTKGTPYVYTITDTGEQYLKLKADV